MPYYDPSEWVAAGDTLIAEVEQKVMAPKLASSKASRDRKAFLPPNTMELHLTTTDTHEALRLTEWQNKLGKIFINLTHDRGTLRKAHFKETRWHQNPNGTAIAPPHHVHFPTRKYPSLDLERVSTYAHPILKEQPDVSYIDALRGFSEYVNIELHGVSIPLIRM